MFKDWKATEPEHNWRDEWALRWKSLLMDYQSRGWKMIPIPSCKKAPPPVNWDEDTYDINYLYRHATEKKGNIAIVAGPSNLLIYEFDGKVAPPKVEGARRLSTPNGWALFLPNPISERLDKELRAVPSFDTVRFDIMYQLVPLSQTFDDNGQLKVREWV